MNFIYEKMNVWEEYFDEVATFYLHFKKKYLAVRRSKKTPWVFLNISTNFE